MIIISFGLSIFIVMPVPVPHFSFSCCIVVLRETTTFGGCRRLEGFNVVGAFPWPNNFKDFWLQSMLVLCANGITASSRLGTVTLILRREIKVFHVLFEDRLREHRMGLVLCLGPIWVGIRLGGQLRH